MESEFASLIELALDGGASYSELTSSIREEVIRAYRERYPDKPQDAHVVIDESEGDVRIFAGKKDVTPTEFISVAARIARSTILRYIKGTRNAPSTPSQKIPFLPKVSLHMPFSLSSLWRVLFWGYNSILAFYLFVFVIGIIGSALSGSASSTVGGLGIYRVLLLFVLLVTPVASMMYVVKSKLNTNTSELIRFFFTVEVPIAVLAYIPTVAFPDPIPAVALFFLLLFLVPVALYKPPVSISLRGNWAMYGGMVLHEVVLITVAYTALLTTFFLPLAIVGFFKEVVAGLFSALFYNSISGLGELIVGILLLGLWGVLIALLTALLFAPYILSMVFVQSFLQRRRELGQRVGMQKATIIAAVTALILVGICVISSYQRSVNRELDELEQIGIVSSFEAREQRVQNLLPFEEELRAALKNISNAGSRYPFQKENMGLARSYEYMLNFDPALAQYVEDTFVLFAHPFVYQGPSDQKGNLYQLFEYVFGSPVYEQSQYRPVIQENVTLVSRTIRATSDYEDLLATVSIEEEYTNKTFQNQEVVYEFSLPSEAVITDLRLGPSLEFTGVIAPRGAARRTYEAELVQRRDPALLEQTGPRQYRLRVFPIPAKNDTATLNGKNQKVRFSYVVGLTPDGYPLPSYSKVTNLVTTNTKTSYWLNDEIVPSGKAAVSIDDSRLDEAKQKLCDGFASLPSRSSTATVSATLIANQETFGEHLSCSGTMDVSQVEIVLENKKIAVLLDVSASQKNFAVAPGLDDIQLLQASQLPLHNVIDVYKFNDRLSEKTTIKNGTESQLIKPVYFGKSDVVKALRLLPDMYDAVIVVTGQEQFEVGNAGAMQSHNFPVYIVHTGDTIPAYSRLFTNYILQSGGGTARSFFEALDQFAAAQQEGQLTSSSYWSIQGNVEEPGDITKVVFTNNVDPLGVLAARGYVYKAIDENEGDIDEQLGILDGLHTFARANHILTPYSSMLSLVNQAQLLRLEEESKRYDRFEEGPMPVTLPSQPIFDMIEPPMLRQESLDLPMFGSPARQKLMGPSEGVSVPEGASFYGGGVGALTGFGGSLPILFILINVVFLGGGVLVFGMKALRARMRKQ